MCSTHAMCETQASGRCDLYCTYIKTGTALPGGALCRQAGVICINKGRFWITEARYWCNLKFKDKTDIQLTWLNVGWQLGNINFFAMWAFMLNVFSVLVFALEKPPTGKVLLRLECIESSLNEVKIVFSVIQLHRDEPHLPPFLSAWLPWLYSYWMIDVIHFLIHFILRQQQAPKYFQSDHMM